MLVGEEQALDVQLDSREKLLLLGLLALILLTFAFTFAFGWVDDRPLQIPGNADFCWDRLPYLFTHLLWASATGMAHARNFLALSVQPRIAL